MASLKPQGKYVFGLDIGTRSIVGTVGYKEDDTFYVAAQEIREHETRAMLDGQIHDIVQVGNTINVVKKALEAKLGIALKEVCIAAAGRVLRTVETNVTWELDDETVISKEEIASLTSLGIEKAYEVFQESNDTDMKFYCVGNSVIRYYMNGYQIGNLESHKAKTIGEDVIATFLPEDVVDGLYRAVEIAGLTVVNMTLEPIAAISVAIPEMYRMLNIALVDVGAGTSDICITKDGCIVAYGMIPTAGDGLTEIIARECLCDFGTAENIKRGIKDNDEVEFLDIMALPQKISKESVLKLVDDHLTDMTLQVADKIKELNGGKPVSAVFVVGGGGKIEGYTDKLAGHLDIIKERVAVRGEEVMQKIIFKEETKKDSLLVTPIGICLNYYEQSNSFIYVSFNDERIKLYDNSALAVVDAAMRANFPNERLFPRRGKEINYTLNGVHKICRGALGEPAVIMVNGKETDLYHEIKSNDVITVKDSTMGPDAVLTLDKIPDVKGKITVKVDKKKITLPKLVLVNNNLVSSLYDVCDGDSIVLLDYYQVKQIFEYMDISIAADQQIFVNNEKADMETAVYDNFSIRIEKIEEIDEDYSYEEPEEEVITKSADISKEEAEAKAKEIQSELAAKLQEKIENLKNGVVNDTVEETVTEQKTESAEKTESEEEVIDPKDRPVKTVAVIFNSKAVVMRGKPEYVFVDLFDYVDFDRKTVAGKNLIMNRNHAPIQYFDVLNEGDVIDVYWEQ